MTVSPARKNNEWWYWLALATVFVMPLASVTVPCYGFGITLFDLLVWLAAASRLVFFRRQVADELYVWARCVWPALLMVVIGLFSLAGREAGQIDLRLAAKAVFQWSEYLLAAPFVLLPILSDATWRRRSFWTLCCSVFAAAVSIGLMTPLADVFAGNTHPHSVGGILGDRHTYTLFMAMALPLLAGWQRMTHADGELLPKGFPWILAPLLFMPFLCLYPSLSGGILFAAVAGLAVAWSWQHRAGWLFIFVLVGALFFCGGETADSRRRELVRSVQVFRPVRQEGDPMATSRLTMRYYRWAADLNMFSQNYARGVGWEQSQKHIGSYYGDIRVPGGKTDEEELYGITANEPHTFSWYFKTGGEIGVLGLAVLGLLLGQIAARCISRPWQAGCNGAGGVLGAVVALALAALWASPIARGTGPLLGMLLALSACPDHSACEEINRKPEEDLK